MLDELTEFRVSHGVLDFLSNKTNKEYLCDFIDIYSYSNSFVHNNDSIRLVYNFSSNESIKTHTLVKSFITSIKKSENSNEASKLTVINKNTGLETEYSNIKIESIEIDQKSFDIELIISYTTRELKI